jgi:hypothetical protein
MPIIKNYSCQNGISAFNFCGQKVWLEIKTSPNSDGYIDLIPDFYGMFVLEHDYEEALSLHHPQFVERFVEKRGVVEWSEKHRMGKCQICSFKMTVFEGLHSVPKMDLDDLFNEGLFPFIPVQLTENGGREKKDDAGRALARLPSNEDVLRKLRSQAYVTKVRNDLKIRELEAEVRKLEEKSVNCKRELEWFREQLMRADKLVASCHRLLDSEATKDAFIVNMLHAEGLFEEFAPSGSVEALGSEGEM